MQENRPREEAEHSDNHISDETEYRKKEVSSLSFQSQIEI
jgi:hypothetical protein